MKIQKTLIHAAFGLILMANAAGLHAQTALTWDDCVKEASTHNLDLLSAEQSVKADEDSHAASLGQFFPQISFNASANRSGLGGLNDALNSPNYGQNASLSLNAKEDIFVLNDFISVDQSNAQLDIARAQLQQAKAQLSHDLKVDFYGLLYAQKQIDLLKTIVDRQKANMDLVDMNFKGGTDNKGSYLQAQAAYEEAVFELNQAHRSLRVSQKQLDQVLGRNPMEPVEVDGDFENPTLSDTLPDFSSLTLQTPAHRQALAQLHQAENQFASSEADFLPTLQANASLSQGGWNFDETQPGWEAGLSLNFPLFTGGEHFFDMQSAGESKKGLEDALRGSDLKTESSLENAYASYADAVEQTQVLQAQLTAAQTQEEIGKAEYLNGLLIFVNWNQLENALTSQQKAMLSGLLNVETSEANWELTQGKGVIP